MRIPQVTDRMKEAPTQALRAFFSGIGQLLLAAEKTRNRDGELGGTSPADADRAAQDSVAASAADPYSSRWRSLDKTGNVRILSPDELDADEPPDASSHDADLRASTGEQAARPLAELDADEPADSWSSATDLPASADEQTASPAAAAAAADPLAALSPDPLAAAAADPLAALSPAAAAPTAAPPPAAPPISAPPAARPATAPPTAAGPAAAVPADLPLPNYDGLSLPSVRARLRQLDQNQLTMLLEYEQANAGRADFLTMFERRIAKLDAGQA